MENEEKKSTEENVQTLNNKTAKKGKEVKTKFNISFPEGHPFSHLQSELKQRGIKHLDLNTLLLEVLEQVPTKWWKEKLDDMTPLEYRVSKALADPQMREKFNELLT